MVLGLGMVGISVYGFGLYGLTLFFVTPFVMGAVSALLFDRPAPPRAHRRDGAAPRLSEPIEGRGAHQVPFSR